MAKQLYEGLGDFNTIPSEIMPLIFRGLKGKDILRFLRTSKAAYHKYYGLMIFTITSRDPVIDPKNIPDNYSISKEVIFNPAKKWTYYAANLSIKLDQLTREVVAKLIANGLNQELTIMCAEVKNYFRWREQIGEDKLKNFKKHIIRTDVPPRIFNLSRYEGLNIVGFTFNQMVDLKLIIPFLENNLLIELDDWIDEPFDKQGLDSKIVQNFLSALKKNTQLRLCDLFDTTELSRDIIAAIITSLPENQLKSLGIGGCNLSGGVATALSEFIANNATLESLNLSNVEWEQNERIEIFNAIGTSKLKDLNMYFNRFSKKVNGVSTEENFDKFVDNVIKCGTLKSINLSRCGIGSINGAEAAASRLIKGCRSLLYISFYSCYMNFEHAKTIAKAVQENPSIMIYGSPNNGFNDYEDYEKFLRATFVNRNIRILSAFFKIEETFHKPDEPSMCMTM